MDFIKTYWPDSNRHFDNIFYPEVKRQALYRFALSSLMLSRSHSVKLYTNEEGASVVKMINIPFSEIIIFDNPSYRYKSFNNLHVLSLQNDPVT
ncbi:MAG TPA: hypothetical protein PLS50_09020, partial [Candidatus Dojkabacteria bacterium]|nr:hypothetical protein [Candidatus Dojkabacteria bacterium]